VKISFVVKRIATDVLLFFTEFCLYNKQKNTCMGAWKYQINYSCWTRLISHSFAALTREISCSRLEINLVFPRTHVLFSIYYIVESEILKNTQWHIFHIFTSEDIDHVTFGIYSIFCLGLYNKQNITRWLEDMTFIFSCWKQYWTHSLCTFVKYCFHHSKIKSLVIWTMVFYWKLKHS
jgi:hypothetical protein